MDDLRHPGTGMGSQGRREGGKQDSLGSVKPQLLQSPGLGRAWCGPTHCTLLLFPPPQLTTCLTSTPKTHLRESTFTVFKRAEARRHKLRQREVRKAKDTLEEKKKKVFLSRVKRIRKF